MTFIDFQPPACMDREQPNAVGHQILRSPDSHRMAGKILNNTWVEPPAWSFQGESGGPVGRGERDGKPYAL